MRSAHWPRLSPVGYALLTVLLACLPVGAQSHTWNGTTGDWSDAGKWDAGVPGAGATVLIPGGEVSLTNTTAPLTSFTMDGGTVVFSNWSTRLVATGIVINAGTVTHVTNLVSVTNYLGEWVPVARVNLECETLVVQSGASINVAAKGYPGGVNPASKPGKGPGGGFSGTRGAGGGHGGRGGPGNYYADDLSAGGDTNGIASAPVNPGSGGGVGSTSGEKGGYGGGAILIAASGSVTNNGLVTANGGNFLAITRSGGGSGGSIFVTCNTIAGSGVFQAGGGNGAVSGIENGGGAGGGGRIAIRYNPTAQSNQPLPQLAFLAGPGSEAITSNNVPLAEIGTLYFPDSRFLDAVELLSPANFMGQLLLGEATNWSAAANLTISNTWIRFPASGFELTVPNDLTLDGNNGRLDVGSTAYRTNELRRVLFNSQPMRSRLDVGGNLRLKKGSLYVFSCATNATVSDYGALVSVTGDLILATGTVVRPISHPENGGSALFRARNVSVEGGALVNADATGFFYDQGPGKGTKNTRAGGAGYGGTGGGGELIYSWGGKPYGSASDPRQPGSGGGSYDGTGFEPGGRGGGLIRMEASGHVLCNGTLSANGEAGMGLDASGGGSGGAIQIVCNTLAATNGLMRAAGGATGTRAGGGGGGRIALRYTPAEQAGLARPALTLSAAGGTGLDRGDLGTVYMPDTVLLPTVITSFAAQLTGFAGWTNDTLTISNCWIRFPEDGFALTVSNGLTLIGSSARLDIGANAALPTTVSTNHYHLYNSGFARPTLSVGGDLILTNGADMYIYSAATNEQTVDYGALATVGGRLVLNALSWINPVCNPTNGGSVLFRVGNLTVASNAGFQANRAGFYSQYGPGKGVFANTRCGGGGYGGKGGQGSAAGSLGGPTYGSSNAPVDGGSGGATFNSSGSSTADYGGRGGGLVRIVAEQHVKLDGTITAAGEAIASTTQNSGAGSGGGVYIFCNRFSGGGAVLADGGTGRVAVAGGGGGGRIAIHRMPLAGGDFTGTVSADGGAGYEAGKAGTIVLVDRRAGTLIQIL